MIVLRRLLLALPALLLCLPAVASEEPAPKAETQGATLANPLARQPLEGLSATRERPLFSPDRRPPPPPPPPVVRAPDPPPPPPPPPRLALYGIVMDSDEAYAIVRADPGTKVVRVRIGDDVAGWKVARVEPRLLVLALEGRLAHFNLFRGERETQAPAPQPPAPATADRGTAAPPGAELQQNAPPRRSRKRRTQQ